MGTSDNPSQYTVLVAEWLPWSKLFFFMFIGAFTLYLLNKLQNRHPFSLFLP